MIIILIIFSYSLTLPNSSEYLEMSTKTKSQCPYGNGCPGLRTKTCSRSHSLIISNNDEKNNYEYMSNEELNKLAKLIAAKSINNDGSFPITNMNRQDLIKYIDNKS